MDAEVLRWKEEGNSRFRLGEYEDSVTAYTKVRAPLLMNEEYLSVHGAVGTFADCVARLCSLLAGPRLGEWYDQG